MGTKILIVEDEPKVASFIKDGLEEKEFQAEIATDGLAAKALFESSQYDAIILDINLPHLNGLELSKIIRAKNPNVPILMLTALGTTDDKINGFESGADDYLLKPFEFRELLVRIKALMKRSEQHTGQDKILKVYDLEYNLDSKVVKRSGKKIDLTAKELGLLEYLIRNKNRVVSRADIAEKVWDINFDTGTNVIDVYVNFLRKKIDKDFSPKLIHTQIGLGYILKDEA